MAVVKDYVGCDSVALPWGAVAECCPVPQPATALSKQCSKTTWNPVLVFVPQLNQGLR